MDLNEFRQAPTSRTHPVYKNSMFTVEAAEYATGEVLLGSVYRKLLLDIHDAKIDLAKVPALKDKLDRVIAQSSPMFASAGLGQALLLEAGGLASPQKSGQQGLQPLRSLMPIVPQVARHACVIGRVRSRWYPGNLLVQVIGAGLEESRGNQLLDLLTDALLVTDNDDLFARFLEQFLERAEPSDGILPRKRCRLTPDDQWGFRGPISGEGRSPAERFCEDLESVLEIKGQLTRRQWCVLLEASLRLGLVTHVLWVCQINAICWQLALDAAGGKQVPGIAEINQQVWGTHRDTAPLVEIGQPAKPTIKRILERYLAARFGLNILLCRLEERGAGFTGVIGFKSGRRTAAAEEIRAFLQHVLANRLSLNPQDPEVWLRQECSDLCDQHPSQVASTSGSTKNLLEFAIYSLGQLKTTPPDRRSYDQSFLLTSDERSSRNQQLAQPGPAMLIFLAHACCRAQGNLPVSLEDFRNHMSDYGLHVPAGELPTGRLCMDLQNLGLVVDSPDAAGGRLLVRPF